MAEAVPLEYSILPANWQVPPPSPASILIAKAATSTADDVLAQGCGNYLRTSLGFLFWRKMSLLLIFVPVAIGLGSSHSNAGAILLTSALAIVPLSALLGDVTEQISLYTNQTVGGLLNITFGNLTELIICILAMQVLERLELP